MRELFQEMFEGGSALIPLRSISSNVKQIQTETSSPTDSDRFARSGVWVAPSFVTGASSSGNLLTSV